MKADCIIVLGYSVDKKGNLHQIQKERVDKGIWLYKKGVTNKIIMSGGFGDWFNPTKKPLGWHMKRYAVKKGIPSKNIFYDGKSEDTVGNAIHSKEIMDKHKYKSAVVVSSDFHIGRVRSIFRKKLGKDYKLIYESSKTNVPIIKKIKFFINELRWRIVFELKGEY